jgi:hypothetical protein
MFQETRTGTKEKKLIFLLRESTPGNIRIRRGGLLEGNESRKSKEWKPSTPPEQESESTCDENLRKEATVLGVAATKPGNKVEKDRPTSN